MKEVEDALRKLVEVFREHDIEVCGYRNDGPYLRIGKGPGSYVVGSDCPTPEWLEEHDLSSHPNRHHWYVITADTLKKELE